MKINSKKYEGLIKKNSNNILNNKINMNNKQNVVKPIENIRYNNDTYNNQYKRKTMNQNQNNTTNNIKYKPNTQLNMNNNANNSMLYTNKASYSNMNNNNNNNLNYYTDYSIDASSTSQNSKVNLYIKKIKEYKKRNQQLVEKLNLFLNNIKLKTNEIKK